MIPVYIGSHERFSTVEPVVRRCIEINSPGALVRFVRPDTIDIPDTGCTGFTNVRYCIASLCRRDGFQAGIYLDVDMLVLSDLSELMGYAKVGKYVCMQDGSTEVGIVSASVTMPSIENIGGMKKYELDAMLLKEKSIPAEWNCEDCVPVGAKLVHFTDLRTQPWFYHHPNLKARALWDHYEGL